MVLGMNQVGAVLRFFFLGLMGAEQAVFEPIHVGMAKGIRAKEPNAHCHCPNQNDDDNEHGLDLYHLIENVWAQADAAREKLFIELRPDASRRETADYL